jgi:hypothetical protein
MDANRDREWTRIKNLTQSRKGEPRMDANKKTNRGCGTTESPSAVPPFCAFCAFLRLLVFLLRLCVRFLIRAHSRSLFVSIRGPYSWSLFARVRTTVTRALRIPAGRIQPVTSLIPMGAAPIVRQ